MNFAQEIKSRISTDDMFRRYGFDVNRQGYVCCPFHSEKTPSMKVYKGDRGYNCFGCGENGDIIDFVCKYFNLSFSDALSKLNDDFMLGLPIGEKLDKRKKLQISKEIFLRKQEQERKKAEQKRLDDECDRLLNEWIRLDRNRREYAPKSPSETLQPLFLEAIQNIGGIEHELELAKIARCKYEHENG